MPTPSRWDAQTERSCRAHVATVCDDARAAAERQRAWQDLLRIVAPHVEAWARRSPVLRRTGLAGEDEVRTVLVDAIARLRDHEFANLRAFEARQAPDEPDDEVRAVEALTRLGDDADDAPADDDLIVGTPLRGWLVSLTRFVIKDHVKRRLGYRPDAAPGEPATRRAVGSGAERLDLQPDRGTRPPLTDLVAMKDALDEIRAFLAGLPAPMGHAVRLWSEELGFDAIAAQLGLGGAGEARNLVRAGQARLREQFRDRWPELFGR
jgi:DNA-directed RNA polymerase specialized sigma24 family protein